MSEAQKPTEQAPQEIIYALAVGYMISRSLHVAADLGIADLLSDGPKSIEELASATGAHRQSLYRLLRLLAGNGVFAEDPSGHFQLTPPAVLLRTGVPGSLRDIVRTVGDLAGDGTWWNMVGQLRRLCSRVNLNSSVCTESDSTTPGAESSSECLVGTGNAEPGHNGKCGDWRLL